MIDPAVLIISRRAPDLFPLSRQVQFATDGAKGCAARLAGMEPPRYDDNESTFPELIARLRRTIDYLATFTPAQIDGCVVLSFVLLFCVCCWSFVGLSFLLFFVLFFFFFNVTTT